MATSSLVLRFPPTLNPKPSSPFTSRIHVSPLPPLPSSSRRPPFPVLSPSLPPKRTPLVPAASAAESNGAGGLGGKEEEDTREMETGESTMPERFRILSKEAPDKAPARWIWLLAVVLLVYSWRTVIWELSNWKKAALAVAHFVGYIGKLILAFIFRFIGSPVTAVIQCFEFLLGFTYSIYSSIIAFTPVPELTNIILLTSAVLAVGESVSPDAVNQQLHLLAAAGFVGFGVINGLMSDIFLLLLLLVSFFCYSKFLKKKDTVTAALPSVALLVAIGEPWLRALAMIGYLALAIFHHSRSSPIHAEDDTPRSRIRPPIPLLLAALSIGIHLAAKVIRQRHLTWMIV